MTDRCRGIVVLGATILLASCGVATTSSPGASPRAVPTESVAAPASQGPSAQAGETPQAVPPGTDAAAQYRIGPAGAQPCAFAAAGDLLYVTDLRKNRIVTIDTGTGLLTGRGQVTNAPCAITALGGALFVSERSVKFLYQRDAGTLEEVGEPLLGPGQIWDVDHGRDAVWYVDRDNGTVVHVDPGNNTALARVEVGGPASGIAVTDDAVWVASEGTDATVRIDPATDAVVARIPTGDGPVWVAATADEAWVTHTDGSVVRIDATTNEVTHTVPLRGLLGEPAILGDAVWVPEQEGGTLTELDLRDGHVGRVLVIHPGLAVAFALGEDLWVTGYTDGLVWRVTPG
jgi:virginiamycin B lyase